MTTILVVDFGDVVLVPFPYSDQTTAKKRPAVVVSGPEYNSSRRDVLIAAISSRAGTAGGLSDVVLGDWQAAGLPRASVFKPVLATIERGLILKKLGSLSQSDRATLAALLRRMMGP